jgi:DNA-binding CsgD family transcriptional regulator
LAGRIQLRRRGRGSGRHGLLVERDLELSVLDQRLAAACEGAGSVVVIEAPAGKGKSRLLTIAGDMAREAGMRVLGGHGSELERDFPFGVAIQLFEPRWISAGPEERAALSQGPARWAAELLAGIPADPAELPDDQGYSVIHGLFWLACNLVARPDGDVPPVPLAMLVDDLQWADRPSLRYLAYLADRTGDLPLLLVVTVRQGEEATDQRALMSLRDAADDSLLRPDSLSDEGVAAIVLSQLPDADPSFCEACARVTGGNPFLLVELIDQVRADASRPNAATARRLAEMAPESVLNAVVARLGAMPESSRAVASAVAVLGDGTPLAQVATFTGLDLEAASRAADLLAAVHLFHPGAPLSFVHPLTASAVRTSMSPLHRGEAHRRAAAILHDQGASDEAVAAHLLVAPPASDRSAVEVLRSAARKAVASGDAESAVRMLRRALAEQPPAEVHPAVLGELGEAELSAGLPEAGERIEAAIGATDDPARRGQLSLAHAKALYSDGRYRDAADTLSVSMRESNGDDPALADEVEAAYTAAASLVPELAEDALRRGERLLLRAAETPTGAQRAALAHVAMQAALRGQDRTSVTSLAELAWGEGLLLDTDSADGLSWPLLTGALLFVDELERDLEICDDALAAARRSDSPAAYATATYCRAWPLYEQGRILDAAADAQAALDARPAGCRTYVRTAYGALACCHIQRGELAHAETALTFIGHPQVESSIHLLFLLDVRAQLRLAQLRPDVALNDALDAGRRLQEDYGISSPGAVAWRSTAALAHLALGERTRAHELAAEELELARAAGITRVMIRDLRVLGLAERGKRGLELLAEAVALTDASPPRLEQIHALIDLGSALRRANRRADARAPLRKALDLSHRGGAAAAAARAQSELSATGARPRRAVLSGAESLTPRELRVGELAAKGLTTKAIAELLFVTPKTVEYHLRHVYQKLGISSRAQISGALGNGDSA